MRELRLVVEGIIMQKFKLFLLAVLLGGAIRIDAGASGGGLGVLYGTVTPGVGATFTAFNYVVTGSQPITTLQAVLAAPGLDPRIYSGINALLAGPTDGTNVLNGIGFSNGTSQPAPAAISETLGGIAASAAADGLLGGLDPSIASITATQGSPVFVQIAPFIFATLTSLDLTVSAPTLPVGIMIKPPAAAPAPINPAANGRTPVAILSTVTFDATTQVDRTSLTFGHAGTEASLADCNPGGQDVNGDGLADLLCHFDNPKSAFVNGDTTAYLIGKTASGITILGSEAITTVPY